MDIKKAQKTLEMIKELVRDNNISYSTAIQLLRLQEEMENSEKLDAIAHMLNSLTVFVR